MITACLTEESGGKKTRVQASFNQFVECDVIEQINILAKA